VNEQPPRATAVIAIRIIARRELVHFVRQPARLAAGIATAVLIWLLIGSGLAGSVRSETIGNISYAAFLMPGMMSLVVMFTAIFGSISLIEERNTGWLRVVLVAPPPRWSIVIGKVSGGAIIAFGQAALLMLAAPFIGLSLSILGVLTGLLALFATAVAMSALGLIFAWKCETTAGFHAVMNLLFMPMWLLSGAFFPPAEASRWLALVAAVNPLAWCTTAVRAALTGGEVMLPLVLTLAFAFASCGAALFVVTRARRAG